MEKLYFIVNPISGSGVSMERFEKLKSLLDSENTEYEAVYTEYPGHGSELAKAALEKGERVLISVGGDGTLREVASVVAGSGAKLGVLPFGTGNDFAKGIGIPDDDEALVKMLVEGRTRKVDAGDANGSFFMNVAGFGFDVDVVRYTEKYKAKLNGMLPYLMGILKSLIHLSRVKATIETDSGEVTETECILLSACNGNRFAGGIKLAPLADQGDGLLDVCVLKSVNRLRFLYLLPKYIKGKHLKYKDFLYFKAKRISCVTAAPMPMELDGELIGETPAVFGIRPGAIELIVGN